MAVRVLGSPVGQSFTAGSTANRGSICSDLNKRFNLDMIRMEHWTSKCWWMDNLETIISVSVQGRELVFWEMVEKGSCLNQLILSYLSRSLADRWGTTVGFTTSFHHSSRISAFRSGIFHSRPIHSLMLSSHIFLSASSSPSLNCSL